MRSSMMRRWKPCSIAIAFRFCMKHTGQIRRLRRSDAPPTQRAGKVNSESFRVVRFEGCKAVSFTYAGDQVAPIPLPRHEPSPMRLSFSPANDGSHRAVTARIDNHWQQDFPNGRVTFVLPSGEYKVDRGRIESAIMSNDSRFMVVTVRVDIAAKFGVIVTASAR
jgi:hypothetical protein